MNTKEILLTSIIALTIGIILVHYEDFIDTDDNDSQPQQIANVSPPPQTAPSVEEPPKDSVTQLKALQISNAPIVVTFWFNIPGKTQFSRHDKLTLYYKIKGLNTASYFTLFNVSPNGKLSIVLDNEPIEVGKLYSLPKAQPDWLPNQFSKQDTRLRLEVGYEYFKAIVTVEPMAWLEFFAAAATKELPQILGIRELEVEVN